MKNLIVFCLIFLMISGAFGAGPSEKCVPPLPGDINSDCQVNFKDLAILAANWMKKSSVSRPLVIRTDSSTPVSDILIPGQEKALAVFRLEAGNIEDLDLDSITVNVENGEKLQVIYLYWGETLLGSRPGSKLASFFFEDGEVVIPAGGNVKITVKAIPLPVDNYVVKNGTLIRAYLFGSDAARTTGRDSALTVNSGEQIAIGAEMKIYEAWPHFSLNPYFPRELILIPRLNHLLAMLDVSAQGEKDITFGESGQIAINIASVRYHKDGEDNLWWLTDENGTVLCSVFADDNAFRVVFAFKDKKMFVVPSGTTKTLYVWGDTREYNVCGDAIQVWLDDSSNYNCVFGIDGVGVYPEGEIIFRPDIWGCVFYRLL